VNHGFVVHNDEDFNATGNGEPLDALHCLGKHDLPANEEISAPSLSKKVFSSIDAFNTGDLSAPGDLQVPQLLGWQQVPAQGILHEQVDLENSVFQNCEEDNAFDNESDANPGSASDDALELISIL